MKANAQQGAHAQGRQDPRRVRRRGGRRASRSSRSSRRSSSAIPGNLPRAAVELAKDWRSDRVLRRLEALLVVADQEHGFVIQRHRRGDRARRWHRSPSARAAATRWPRRARCSAQSELRPREIVRQSPRDRRRHLHLHQHQHHGARAVDGRAYPLHAVRPLPAPADPPRERPNRPPWLEDLTPRQIVAELDRYIVGQDEAKKAVAIALRNRWRRAQAPEDIRDEITAEQHHPDRPHRRRQDGDRAPAGAAGRRAVRQGRGLEVHRSRLRRPRRRVDGARPGRRRRSTWCATEREDEVEDEAQERVEERLLDLLLPPLPTAKPARRAPAPPGRQGGGEDRRPVRGLVQGRRHGKPTEADAESQERRRRRARSCGSCSRTGKLEEREVEVEVSSRTSPARR